MAAITRTFTKPDGEVGTATITAGDVNSVSDLAESFDSDFTQTTGRNTRQSSPAATAGDSSPAATGSQNTAATPSTLLTSTTPTGSTAAEQTGDTTGIASGANGETPSQEHQNSCNSISCNPGLQAAIAVPVVVVSLLLFALLFFCLRRRRRRPASPVSEKKKAPKKKWSRHLRVFSFDAELLMGGRFSSSNSLRSRGTGSQRSNNSRAHNASPSIHSIEEEVAPPYRDAVSHAQPPSTVPMAGGMTSTTPDPFPRPDSTATAPPPYPAASPPPGNAGSNLAVGAGAAAGAGAVALGGLSRNTSRASTQNIQTPVSTRSLNDPFRNDTLSPVSPVDDGPDSSPFVDPPEEAPSPTSPTANHPMIARTRNAEVFDDARSEVSSTMEVSSVREAQIGRTLSTRAGRIVGGRGDS